MAATTTHDDRIDAYIAKSADFAKPILGRIRKLIHKACPDATETIKWGMPFFEYNGSPLCNMAGFKEHCAFGFWNAAMLTDPEGILQVKDKNAMGHLDRLVSMKRPAGGQGHGGLSERSGAADKRR
ncbi:DUF1801 domain-containing protein [Puia sp. P3]|uniref:DUF1801 domain-containing protein n=1 Tax=Puia sp. P3 TaxID=3423952 RepID=UPI003D667DF3